MKVKNEKGFSLAELIVIIVIVGILALVAVPKFLDIEKTNQCKLHQKFIEMVATCAYADSAKIGKAVYPASIQAMVEAKLLIKAPKCPSGGEYTYDRKTGKVICSLTKHARTKE